MFGLRCDKRPRQERIEYFLGEYITAKDHAAHMQGKSHMCSMLGEARFRNQKNIGSRILR